MIGFVFGMQRNNYGVEIILIFLHITQCVCFTLSGTYISMDMSDLPPFWLAFLSDPSDSGRIHSNIRQRWLSGTPSYQTLLIWKETESCQYV